MAHPEPLSPRVSVDDYLAIMGRGNVKYEYHDGSLVAMAGGTANHDRISNNAIRLIEDGLGDRPCQVFSGNMMVRFLPTEYRLPDVTVTCDEQDWGDTREITSPRVLMEVLSPSTEKVDRLEKLILAKGKETVQEYALIWTRYQCVEVYRRQDQWKATVSWPGDVVELQSIHVEFAVTSLYRRTTIPATPEDAP